VSKLRFLLQPVRDRIVGMKLHQALDDVLAWPRDKMTADRKTLVELEWIGAGHLDRPADPPATTRRIGERIVAITIVGEETNATLQAQVAFGLLDRLHEQLFQPWQTALVGARFQRDVVKLRAIDRTQKTNTSSHTWRGTVTRCSLESAGLREIATRARPAMPTWAELNTFFAKAPTRPDRDPALSRLHRVTVPRQVWDEVFVFAFDHRAQFYDVALEAGADESRLPRLKQLFVKAVEQDESDLRLPGRIGFLADDRYGHDALADATGRGWWIGRRSRCPAPIHSSRPGSFDRQSSVRVATRAHRQVPGAISSRRCVANRLQQETQLLTLFEAVQASGHELLVEIVAPRHLPQEPDTVLARDEAPVQHRHRARLVEARTNE